MTLKEYIDTVLGSKESDWTGISDGGRSYLDALQISHGGQGRNLDLELNSHHNAISYKHDLSISLAWGYTVNEDFSEDWANSFPNPAASSHYLDFYYNGALIFRDVYVTVDGGRVMIPLPKYDVLIGTENNPAYKVQRRRYQLYQIIANVTSGYDYGNYFQRTGIPIVDDQWPD